MALMPALGALAPDRLVAIGRGLGVAALVLVPFLAIAGRVVPPLLTRVARTRDQELFLLVALAIGLGTAALTQAVGLSLALGAFLAGLLISTSDFAHETLARLLPLRDTFGAFFFVTVGALIDPSRLLANVPLLVAMVLLVVVGKLVIRAGVVWLFGESLWTALLTGIGLAQIGEFSFVLVQAARQEGHVGPDVYQATLAASLLSIVVNAALVRLVPRYLGALRAAGHPPAQPAPDPRAGAPRDPVRLRPGGQRGGRSPGDVRRASRRHRERSGRRAKPAGARGREPLRGRRSPAAAARGRRRARGPGRRRAARRGPRATRRAQPARAASRVADPGAHPRARAARDPPPGRGHRGHPAGARGRLHAHSSRPAPAGATARPRAGLSGAVPRRAGAGAP